MWVPDLCLQAHLRVDPDMAGMLLAFSDGTGTGGAIAAVTPLAANAGVLVGMRVSQARAVSVDTIIRPLSPEAIGAALAALADVASTVSARVEIDERGLVFCDCEGAGLLSASESELATVLAARAFRCGLPAWVGIADSKLGALIAARESGGTRVVPAGLTRDFLAPFPVKLLDPDPVTADVLRGWGIRTMGQLAALPPGSLAHRLGRAGMVLARCARGDDVAPLIVRPTPLSFDEGMALDYGLERLEPLVFILRRLIECVATRIELCGFTCQALEIRLELEGGGHDLRTVRPAAPTLDAKVLVTVARAELEFRPPSQPVIGVVVGGLSTRSRPTQLDLLRPVGPVPDVLASTLARLAILCGSDRVGMLRQGDTHRPDAVEVEPFDDQARTVEDVPDPDPDVVPPGAVVRLALRAFRPPVSIEVFENRGQLDFVRGDGFGGRVVQWAGPRRLRGEWWTAEPYAREYYDVELSDGGVYRIYRDVRRQCWVADGVYD
jgi:protein ImuB